MAKANLQLPDGTIVTVEGTIEEVNALLSSYQQRIAKSRDVTAPSASPAPEPVPKADSEISLIDIVTKAKTCDEADRIEKTVLDRSSQVDRILLPLWILDRYFPGAKGLTTGDIAKVTRELGVPVSVANVSNVVSGAASRYVVPDKPRGRGGAPPRYLLVRKGRSYMEGVLGGNP